MMTPEVMEDHCERCGEVRPGRRKWVFYRWHARLPDSPVAQEFYCSSCIRIMRIYAIIGLTLVIVIAAAAVVATIWLNSPSWP